MLATRILQKEGTFFFISYKAQDLLGRVRFTSRFYFEGERIEAEAPGDDDVARFIGGVEKSEKSFQRVLNKRKVSAIFNFYETAVTQPVIPGTILLFTEEQLRFEPMGSYKSMGNLSEPRDKFLIIDGQHRLAALHFFARRHPEQIDQIEVPCILFDGKSADFATEMFVIINSTHTRINKSHLVDLYEKISWESREKKCAARIVNYFYQEDDSPLQYKINRLGGRSRQEKWILQSELFNEINKVVEAHKRLFDSRFNMRPKKIYEPVRDYFKAVREVMGEIWGKNDRYMFTRDVTLKALVRVFGSMVKARKVFEAWQEEPTHKTFVRAIRPWKDMTREFRAEGFYERFPAKGQVERVRRIHEKLLAGINIG